MNQQPVSGDACSDCGTMLPELHADADSARCPACFERHLFDLDVGFLDNYRRFGARGRLIVAETCLRGLVTDSPDHRKVLAMQIFEQYVQAMSDLVALFSAFRDRREAPIMRSFLEFKLDASKAGAFFAGVRSLSDVELLTALDLPTPVEVALRCPHLSQKDAYQVSIAVYHLVQDLRKTTEQGEMAALALGQIASGGNAAMIADNVRWLNDGDRLTPDQVALVVLDSEQQSIHVQGLSAEEGAMGQVVDAIDTVTRAASNLAFAYLQVNDL